MSVVPKITNRPKIGRVTDAQIIKALELTGGFLSAAAQRLGCHHRTISRRVKSSKKVREALENIVEKKLDLAEAALMRSINNGEPWAVKFYLRHKGASRGYASRMEITGKGGGPLDMAIDISDEELDKIINGD